MVASQLTYPLKLGKAPSLPATKRPMPFVHCQRIKPPEHVAPVSLQLKKKKKFFPFPPTVPTKARV